MSVARPDAVPLTIAEAGRRLRAGTLTSTALTEAYLARAAQFDARLGVYITRFDDAALRAAEHADRELAAGRDRGPLHGIPLGVKDLLAAAEGPTAAQSTVLDPAWGAGRDATVVARLRDAGAVILGKTTTLEYELGTPVAGDSFPLARNPWNLETWPGGSSSGSANGVAGGFFAGAIGSDTAGSIRMPAAFTGITGIMATLGLVSKAGCVPLSNSLDRVGPLARSAWDCAAILGAITGPDPADPSSVRRDPVDYLAHLGGGIEGLRIGVDLRHCDEAADPEVVASFVGALEVLAGLGATLLEVSLPFYDEMLAALLVILTSESEAYQRDDLGTSGADYQPSSRTASAGGAFLDDGDLVQAQRVRQMAIGRLQELFEHVDVVAEPTTTCVAPPLEAVIEAGSTSFADRIHTAYWDPTGSPAIALPVGFTSAGLPVSLQLAGRPFEDATLLRLAHTYQGQTDWHLAVAPDPSDA